MVGTEPILIRARNRQRPTKFVFRQHKVGALPQEGSLVVTHLRQWGNEGTAEAGLKVAAGWRTASSSAETCQYEGLGRERDPAARFGAISFDRPFAKKVGLERANP